MGVSEGRVRDRVENGAKAEIRMLVDDMAMVDCKEKLELEVVAGKDKWIHSHHASRGHRSGARRKTPKTHFPTMMMRFSVTSLMRSYKCAKDRTTQPAQLVLSPCRPFHPYFTGLSSFAEGSRQSATCFLSSQVGKLPTCVHDGR